MTSSCETQIKGLCSVFLQMSQHAPTSIQAGGYSLIDPQAQQGQQADRQIQGRRASSSFPSGITYPVRLIFPAEPDEEGKEALFAEIREGLGRLGYETHNAPLPTERAGVLEFAQGVYFEETQGAYRLDVTMAPPYHYARHRQMMGDGEPAAQPT